jgi:hypothetical protein
MTDMERWLEANDQFLAAAVAWVRARLEQAAGAQRPVAALPPAERDASPAVEPPPQRRSLIGRFIRSEPVRSEPGAAESVRVLPPAASDARPLAPAPAAKVQMPAAVLAAEGATEPPALVVLGQRLALSDFERETLLLCVAMELDTSIAGLCARAQGDAARPYPTFALALTLFDHPAWEVTSPERPLRFWRLVEVNQTGLQPLVASALKADERIVNYVKGLNYVDDRLTPLLTAIPPDDGALPRSQERVAEQLAAELQRTSGGTLPVLQLLGSDSEAKRLIAGSVASQLGLALYRLPADALPQPPADLETFIRLWQRESMLLPVALYVDVAQLDRAASGPASALYRLFSRGAGVTFLDTREPWPEIGRATVIVDTAKPTPGEQHGVWVEALEGPASDLPSRLAGQFNFNASTIRTIAAQSASGDPRSRDIRLWDAALRHARPALDQLAQALEPKALWTDLELPAPERQLLHRIADQVKGRREVYDQWGFRERMNRGLGISVLFAGESGTGKTMAAEVIANDLRLGLYRIDLSAVVSKYIGETEKNLRRLFDAAEDGGAILFFDEADALFGKRSEVKDSHDRYANIEINYLLQRMESYRGLAILATNMKASMDTAFLRRLRFIVNFPFPGPAERLAMWQKVFPPDTPRGDLDFARLARLNLTGGSIHNVALNAAFLAAQAGTPVTTRLILDAARTEFRKLDKPINEAEFRVLESAGGAR